MPHCHCTAREEQEATQSSQEAPAERTSQQQPYPDRPQAGSSAAPEPDGKFLWSFRPRGEVHNTPVSTRQTEPLCGDYDL